MTPLPRLRALVRPLQPHTAHTRSISWFGFGKKKDSDSSDDNITTSSHRTVADLLKASPRTSSPSEQLPVRGALSDSSIFSSDAASTETAAKTAGDVDLTTSRLIKDPNRANWSWPKRADDREVRRRGRYTRIETIARTEKEHIAASHFFKTSIKKLAPLARQIAGKPVEDAIVQMRFSGKKAAKEVLAHLHHAKNEAIVRKAMVPAEMYIAQAWVGRGPFEQAANPRAKGRMDVLQLPYTKITVQLKEKVTLERIAREKVEKRKRLPVRQHLPSRPIYGQRQYYQW